MKTMTCRQLGGACDQEFHAETFEEIAAKSQLHGREMFAKADEGHLQAMEAMRAMPPEAVQAWLEEKRQEFDALPEDK